MKAKLNVYCKCYSWKHNFKGCMMETVSLTILNFFKQHFLTVYQDHILYIKKLNYNYNYNLKAKTSNECTVKTQVTICIIMYVSIKQLKERTYLCISLQWARTCPVLDVSGTAPVPMSRSDVLFAPPQQTLTWKVLKYRITLTLALSSNRSVKHKTI